MKKLGIAVSDFGASQLNYLIVNNVNEYLKDNYKTDIIGFYENLTKYSLNPQFSCMQSVEMWGYDGTVIATNLNAASDIIKIPTVKNRIFYIWDLEWVHLMDKNYEALDAVYTNPKLVLATRCDDYAQLIEKMWNVKVQHVIEDFNVKELMEIK